MTARESSAIDAALADYLRAYLFSRGISVLALAKLTGIPHATLRHYVSGQRRAGFGDVILILDTLGLDVPDTIERARRIAAEANG